MSSLHVDLVALLDCSWGSDPDDQTPDAADIVAAVSAIMDDHRDLARRLAAAENAITWLSGENVRLEAQNLQLERLNGQLSADYLEAEQDARDCRELVKDRDGLIAALTERIDVLAAVQWSAARQVAP